jgi:sulfite exporter TauE/SafE
MIGWLMILISGLLGSSHCVGMCGGFALALGSATTGLRSVLVRQVVYGLGRVFTYTVGGAAAGFLGWRLESQFCGLVNLQAGLSILAGSVLVIQGLHAAGWLPRWRMQRRAQGCLGPTLFGRLLQDTRAANLFLGGVVNGLLPCGLVYAFLALAASSGDLPRGALTMLLFGLGTVPVLALVGLGGSILSLATRRRLLHLAAWCVVLTGVITLARGIGFLSWLGTTAEVVCPFCFPG